MSIWACGRIPTGENLGKGVHALGGTSCVVAFESAQPALRARVDVRLRWQVRECPELPATLRLVADMPQMSHGPTAIELVRDGDLYEGSILFVMGGRWELAFFDGERELLRGWLDVAER